MYFSELSLWLVLINLCVCITVISGESPIEAQMSVTVFSNLTLRVRIICIDLQKLVRHYFFLQSATSKGVGLYLEKRHNLYSSLKPALISNL